MLEENSEAKKPSYRQKVRMWLLKKSPFVTHMHCRLRHVSLNLEGDLTVQGEEGFASWAERESQFFPEKILKEKVTNEQIIYSKASKFEKYKDKSILIIGGGPSTAELDFSKVSPDFMWSVNHFYLNPVIKKLKIDMAMIMGEPDTTSKEFLGYRDKFEPMIGFEIHDRWKGFKFDDYDNYFLMHTDFYSKLGACVRMIIFACLLGVKKISFVGLDGPKYIVKGEHAFEKGKTSLPSEFSPKIYEWHYWLFWNYIKESFKGVEFENLGYGQEYHRP